MIQAIKPLKAVWYKRLVRELPYLDGEKCHSILNWLLSCESDSPLASPELDILNQRLAYRYRILHQRYLFVDSHQAYRQLISRLGSVLLSINSVQTWITKQSQSRQETLRLIQKLIHELLDNDSNLQNKLSRIPQYTTDAHLSKALVLATIEEYCMYPIHGQPLLLHLLRQYLKCQLQAQTNQAA
ncbi:MAG TPA: hypothetical protein DCF68_12705 [Cyanothece sp. UBA12306]|nr:hypothetical protein [Cyanothece sp. UBA12306]